MEKITSRKNPLCIHMKKLGASRSYQEQCGEFLCDGMKLLEEAVMHGVEIKAVLTASQVPFPLPVETRVYSVPRDLIDSLSPLKNAQDTLFTCKIPEKDAGFDAAAGTHILLDGVQDPGNVGTIIRTANAFGIRSVILTDGCADSYNPKTLRASMGAVFRHRICRMSVPELVRLRESGVRFIGAALDGRDIRDISLKDAVIAIGSEGRGLSEDVLALCTERVTIPMSQECESLNAAAAAAIIMWEIFR